MCKFYLFTYLACCINEFRILFLVELSLILSGATCINLVKL